MVVVEAIIVPRIGGNADSPLTVLSETVAFYGLLDFFAVGGAASSERTER